MADIQANPTTERVKQAAHQYLKKARMAGPNNVIALCPFHQDASPSFAMNIHNGLYICYACGAKGNFRTFLKGMGLSKNDIDLHYGKTLEDLKRNTPPPPDPNLPTVTYDEHERPPEDLLGLFHVRDDDELKHVANKVLELDLDLLTLRRFEVGVDKKHNRVTFPLRDLRGNFVGVSGRAMSSDQSPRYKVYREEYKTWGLPAYDTDKSHLLWNAHRVYPEVVSRTLPQGESIVVVEGFKGAMWLSQAGVPNVVALMTKTLSWTQRWILLRFGGPYTLMLDNDEAGMEGTVYVSSELQKTCGSVRVVEYEQRQPTDVPLEDIRQLIETASDCNDMLLSEP